MTPLPFDLAQLRCFVVLSETLHFGKAAVRLHMTQPPLSRQIALLEASLGEVVRPGPALSQDHARGTVLRA